VFGLVLNQRRSTLPRLDREMVIASLSPSSPGSHLEGDDGEEHASDHECGVWLLEYGHGQPTLLVNRAHETGIVTPSRPHHQQRDAQSEEGHVESQKNEAREQHRGCAAGRRRHRILRLLSIDGGDEMMPAPLLTPLARAAKMNY